MRKYMEKELKLRKERVLKLPNIELVNITQEQFGLCSFSDGSTPRDLTELKVKPPRGKIVTRLMSDASPTGI